VTKAIAKIKSYMEPMVVQHLLVVVLKRKMRLSLDRKRCQLRGIGSHQHHLSQSYPCILHYITIISGT